MISRFSTVDSSAPRKTWNQGFTLIETLVTLTLLALVLGLVAPMGVRSFERAQAKSEVIVLRRYLVLAREHAYSIGQPLTIDFDGRQVRTKPTSKFHPVKSTLTKRPLEFDHLFFQRQSIELNELGFAAPRQLIYRNGTQEHVIDLRWLLNNQA